jgi:hypothetical protein
VKKRARVGMCVSMGARRGAAIRSYLLSAPRLVVMIWAREVQRWRLGLKRPG